MSLKNRSLRILLLLGLCCLGVQAVTAGAVTVPVTFTSGTPANAADVNADFTALANAINTLSTNLVALQSSVASATPSNMHVIKDSNGLLVGQYFETYGGENEYALMTVSGYTFFTWINSPGFLSPTSVYYSGVNCTGSGYVVWNSYGGNQVVKSIAPLGTVVGANAYIPGSAVGIVATQSSKSTAGGCVSDTSNPGSLYSVAATLSLAQYVPPFILQ